MSRNQQLPLADKKPPDIPEGRGAAAIEAWLVSNIANLAGMDPSEIDRHQPFAYFGLGSAEAVILAGDLEDWLGHPVPATLAFDYPSIESLANHLAGKTSASHGDSTADFRQPSDAEEGRLLTEIEQLSENEARTALDRESR